MQVSALLMIACSLLVAGDLCLCAPATCAAWAAWTSCRATCAACWLRMAPGSPDQIAGRHQPLLLLVPLRGARDDQSIGMHEVCTPHSFDMCWWHDDNKTKISQTDKTHDVIAAAGTSL